MIVLIVDDAVFMRMALRNILARDCGVSSDDIYEAGSGIEALELYCDLRPDIVFLDTHMPGVSGSKVLRALIKIDPGAKVIMYALADNLEEMPELVGEGAKGYITKPPQPRQITQVIEQATGRKIRRALPINIVGAPVPGQQTGRAEKAAAQPGHGEGVPSAQEQMQQLKSEISTLKEEVLALRQLFESLDTDAKAENLKQDILTFGRLFESSDRR